MSTAITPGTVLGAIKGSRVLEDAIRAAMPQKPSIRRIRDEPCESCARRVDVAIFDDAARPCPRLCADCMRAGIEVLR